MGRALSPGCSRTRLCLRRNAHRNCATRLDHRLSIMGFPLGPDRPKKTGDRRRCSTTIRLSRLDFIRQNWRLSPIHDWARRRNRFRSCHGAVFSNQRNQPSAIRGHGYWRPRLPELHVQCFGGSNLRMDPASCCWRIQSTGAKTLPSSLRSTSLGRGCRNCSNASLSRDRNCDPTAAFDPGGKTMTNAVQETAIGTGKYADLLIRCERLDPIPTAVAHPCEATALSGAIEAAKIGLITPILVGPAAKIEIAATSAGVKTVDFEIVDVPHSVASATKAVELLREGRAELLMKGSLHTDELMAAVISREGGLRTGRRISHVFVMDVPTYHKVLIITDGAINIAPTLEDKADICQNAIDLAVSLGRERPKVAILSAVETVTTRMPATIDAAALCKMAERGQIKGGILDGPLAFDNAISREAAITKDIHSPVAGAPDILLAPELEAGNILAKQLSFLANADSAGLVLGARVPIVLTSRADSVRARTASCAVAMLAAHARREKP